jgi:hypothetical protein
LGQSHRRRTFLSKWHYTKTRFSHNIEKKLPRWSPYRHPGASRIMAPIPSQLRPRQRLDQNKFRDYFKKFSPQAYTADQASRPGAGGTSVHFPPPFHMPQSLRLLLLLGDAPENRSPDRSPIGYDPSHGTRSAAWWRRALLTRPSVSVSRPVLWASRAGVLGWKPLSPAPRVKVSLTDLTLFRVTYV